MSQFGMNLPGARQQRRAELNVYTALMVFAVVALGAAAGTLFVSAGKLSPEGSGNPLALQKAGSVKLEAPRASR